MSRLSLAEVERRQQLRQLALQPCNAAAMHRVAARLPACVIAPQDCPLHKHEARTLAGVRASTTTTTGPRLDGFA